MAKAAKRFSPNPAKPRVIFFGTPNCAADTLQALLTAGYPVVAAVTQPDRPSGRHAMLSASAVSVLATTAGVTVLKPKNRSELAADLKKLTADIGVLFAYGSIIPEAVLDQLAHGIINIHPSLLPKHRGPSPVPAAILSGEPTTGVTLIQLDAEVDHGPILVQRSVQIGQDETADQLHDRLAKLGIELLLEILPSWLAGELHATPQDHTQATMSRTLQRSDGKVDFKQPVEVIYRRYRALYPWPGSYTLLGGQRLKLLHMKPQRLSTPLQTPGQLRLEHGSILVSCGDGLLKLEEVQLEGRRSTRATDLVNGHPEFLQLRLG